MGLQKLTNPTTLACCLEQLQQRMGISTDELVNELTLNIQAAQDMIEKVCWTKFFTTQYKLTFRDFYHACIFIPIHPLISVDSIAYYNESSVLTTISTSIYEINSLVTPAVIMLKDGQSWPTDVNEQENAVEITFTSGYGIDLSDIPASAQLAVLHLARRLYEDPDCYSESGELPPMIKALLKQSDIFIHAEKIIWQQIAEEIH